MDPFSGVGDAAPAAAGSSGLGSLEEGDLAEMSNPDILIRILVGGTIIGTYTANCKKEIHCK